MEDSTEESFWLRVNKVALTGCWLWTGYINKINMYGQWTKWIDGKSVTLSVPRNESAQKAWGKTKDSLSARPCVY